MPFDRAYDNLKLKKKELQEYCKQDLNESETRLKILDCIFIEILGWPKEAIKTEVTVGDTATDLKHKTLYADYVLSCDQTEFLIEAKRTGRSFDLPTSNRRIYKSTAGIYETNKSVIDQAKNYMRKLGTAFCVLSNGIEFMIIRQKAFEQDKDTVVFRNIDEIEMNFPEFWSILSPFSNGALFLDELLKIPDELRQPPVNSNTIFEYVKRKDVNFLQTNYASKIAAESYLRRYFDEITSESQIDILKACYCDPSGNFAMLSDVLKTKMVSEPITAIRKLTTNVVYGIDGNFERDYLENLKDDLGNVFVLLGGVGSGKSTFIKHFYNFELDSEIRGGLIWVHLDFLDFTDPLSELNKFITKEIFKILLKKYSDLKLEEWEIETEIYKDDIEIIIKGIPPMLRGKDEFRELTVYQKIQELKNDSNWRLDKICTYLRENLNKKLCFVFDNIDQKTFEEQEVLFMISFDRANQYKATVITSLRLESYFLLKNKPPFDAYSIYEYRIEPPSVKALLNKRLVALNENPQRYVNISQKGMLIRIPITKLITILENTINNPQNNTIEMFFENMSGGNMRRALRLFKSFVQSEYSKIHEITGEENVISYLKNINFLSVDFEYVLDSLSRLNSRYYKSEISDVKNLFVYYDDGFYSHFTQIYILLYLENKLDHTTKTSGGYVDIEDLFDNFSLIFLTKDRLVNVLEPMLSNYLIESDMGARSHFSGTRSVCISVMGKYYLNNLISDWRYLQHIIVDTPIRNHKSYTEILESYLKLSSVKDKASKMRVTKEYLCKFFDYLEECEKEECELIAKVNGGKNLPVGPFIPHLKQSFIANFRI